MIMIFRDVVGLKLPDICLTGEQIPEKTSPRKLVPTGDRTRVRCVTGARMIPPAPQRRTQRTDYEEKFYVVFRQYSWVQNIRSKITESTIWRWSIRSKHIIITPSSSECSVRGNDPSLQAQEPRLQFFRRQVFHRKLRNQGWSFTRDWIGAVASRSFLHRTLSLAFEQILKDLERSQGHQRGGKDLGNWALRTLSKFTREVKYKFHQAFLPDQRSGNPNHPSPPPPKHVVEHNCTHIKKWKWYKI